jgi:hypothetical protein
VTRHNAYMTDEDWSAAERLAVLLTIERRKPVSVSEAIRLAVGEAVAAREKKGRK